MAVTSNITNFIEHVLQNRLLITQGRIHNTSDMWIWRHWRRYSMTVVARVVNNWSMLTVMMNIAAYFGNKLLNFPNLLGNVYIPKCDPVTVECPVSNHPWCQA